MLVQDRFLTITGRVKEQFKNAFGEYVAPVKLEQLLEDDPLVSRALIIGTGRPHNRGAHPSGFRSPGRLVS